MPRIGEQWLACHPAANGCSASAKVRRKCALLIPALGRSDPRRGSSHRACDLIAALGGPVLVRPVGASAIPGCPDSAGGKTGTSEGVEAEAEAEVEAELEAEPEAEIETEEGAEIEADEGDDSPAPGKKKK